MSSISFGSTAPVSYQPLTQNPAQQLQANVKQLAQSLQGGDLAGAQQAYSSLQQTLGSGASSSANPLNKDLSSLGQALQSGNLSNAQQAFAQLGQDAQATTGKSGGGKAHGAHHHHAHGGGGAKASGQSVSAGSVSSTAATTSVAGASASDVEESASIRTGGVDITA